MFIDKCSCILQLLLVILVFSGTAEADSEWYWQHPSTSSYNINDVFFIGDNHGWVVTDEGAVFITVDGAATWAEQLCVPYKLYGVFFKNSSEGWVCGEGGRLYRTTSGGDSWSQSILGSNDLLRIEFSDESYGTITGASGTVYRTNNGGTTWSQQGSGTGESVNDVSFITPTEGWITGSIGQVLHTVTAGAFWDSQETGILALIQGVQFNSSLVGLTCGGYRIARTSDGGENWSVVHVKTGADYQDLDFSGDLCAAAAAGYVTVSTDLGLTWQEEFFPPAPSGAYTRDMLAVSVPSSNAIYIGGELGQFYFRDSQGVWSAPSSYHTFNGLNSITHIGENAVWACGGYGRILSSSDGGVSWSSAVTQPNYVMRDIAFTDLNTGYCVGGIGTYDPDGVIFKTEDGGNTWTDVTPTALNPDRLWSVDFMDPLNGVAVGDVGEIFYTTDGGDSWQRKAGFGSSGLYRVRFGDTDRGWITGANGKIICFDFSTDSWSEQESAMTGSFYGLYPLNSDTVWAVGWNGTVARTTNTGNYWETLAVTGNDYWDVWFADNGLDGCLTPFWGGSSEFGTTTNGGYTITHSPVGARENRLIGLTMIDKNNGWGCGLWGSILRYCDDPSGVTEFNQPVSPHGTAGIQVSANPFTAYTSICISLPVSDTVSIAVYDITGRVVERLHSGALPGGEHSFTLQGNSLPPGVYFVRMSSDTVSESRSIIRIP